MSLVEGVRAASRVPVHPVTEAFPAGVWCRAGKCGSLSQVHCQAFENRSGLRKDTGHFN
jgi:hypothetical protein